MSDKGVFAPAQTAHFDRIIIPFSNILLKGFFIMDELFYKMVQGQIGYEFDNPDLLQQAFVRKSYSAENGGADNEILEFIGDKALDIAVVRFLTEKYGCLADEYEDYNPNEECNEFYCEYSEGELTKLKMQMVEKKALSKRIDELGFADFLIMGKGDIQRNISAETSVKEDLFEAVIGAVAIDSQWDFDTIQEVVEIMLDPESFLKDESEKNYVRLIQEWELRKNKTIPFYKYFNFSYTSSWFTFFDGISQKVDSSTNYNELNYSCLLKLRDDMPIFRGFGRSKSEARKAVCKVAYSYIEEHDLLFSIRDEIENPNKKDAINQLEILARRGYFSIPVYQFTEIHDSNGNPIWEAVCSIREYHKNFKAKSSSKRDAKKTAAYKMLMFVLKSEDN